MTKSIALLLDDPENRYQRLLEAEARGAASRRGLRILDPEFARGSSWTQVESVNRLLREGRPDGALLMLAGEQWTRAPFERLVRSGAAVGLLNRIPDWVGDLRRDHPKALIAAVTPRQEGIGAIQARQALRLVAPGAFVLLVTGGTSSAAAAARRRGFVEALGGTVQVHDVDGRWTAAGAQKAVQEWLRLGAERGRPIALVVCQNDAMAAGVRAALASSDRPDLARTPLIGCDGLAEEGRAMVSRGELAATVVMPPTSPAAIDALDLYWTQGVVSGTVLIDAVSYPPVDEIGARGGRSGA